MNIRSLLVVAAHPDDEILGCGGTVSRLSNDGVICNCVILSKGIASRYNKEDDIPEGKLEELSAHTLKATKIVGYTSIRGLAFPDNRFDSVPLLEIVKAIEALVDELKPDTILTHHKGDLNRDHELTHRAVLIATRPIEGTSVKNLLTFEIPSSTEWSFSQFNEFQPNYFCDIRDHVEKKIEAMAVYEGESRAFPHPRSGENLRALAQLRGASVGMRAAEAFEIIRICH
ncbi:MAG: PIG-L family deacetylase [Gammaproteobacteria bacterium]|nr:PIG-L family deacetylase [Gammaproteobacteria bacterium]